MKIKTDTDFLVIPDTYGSNFQANVNDNCWNEVHQIMVDKAKEYMEEYLQYTELHSAQITFGEFHSPRFYNYGTDWIPCEIEFDDSLLDIIKNKASDEFFEWANTTLPYRSGNGWCSFYPTKKEEFIKAIDQKLTEEKLALAVTMFLAWQIKSKFDLADIQQKYLDECWDEISENGYEVDEEEEIAYEKETN